MVTGFAHMQLLQDRTGSDKNPLGNNEESDFFP